MPATRTAPTGHELADVPIADNVFTDQLRHAHLCCRDTVRGRTIGLITGDPGLGKTHAVDRYFTEHRIPHVRVEPSALGRSPKSVLYRLLSVLRPEIKPRGTAIELVDELKEILAEEPRTLIIDEAQRLDVTGLNLIRELHDAPQTDFPLLLVGGAGVTRTLATDPALLSRVERTSRFKPMKGSKLVAALHELHPLLAATDQSVLEDLDRRVCRGHWRDWLKVTRFVLDRAEAAGYPDKITPKLARAASSALNPAP
ncbi:ATP-binding protein [Nitriliruptor alkaliphilus]|uniref:ATP-binding protein n=1 Tax=Nitriliruptor alkaliphilus TaxID=427918 RepID=UPI0006978EC4|nr:ATP-binding protein [Nitriliruptor alkaliphilus]